MCGRIACTLNPGELCQSCTYKHGDETNRLPEWKEAAKFKFRNSYNLAPSQIVPVLVSKNILDPDCKSMERVITPMVWGFIPPNHKGSINDHGMKTHNSRSERIQQSPFYSGSLREGKRCVVLCDGFYEWTQAEKQPYFIYLTQPDGVKLEDRETWKTQWSQTNGWKGPRLLSMAGIFSEWTSPEGKKVLNCSVLTMESSGPFSTIHNRMPVILDTEEKISDWLNSRTVKVVEAMKMVHVTKQLVWHPVSKDVNSSKFNSIVCIKPINIMSKLKSQEGSKLLMQSWLQRANNSKSVQQKDEDKDVVKCSKPAASQDLVVFSVNQHEKMGDIKSKVASKHNLGVGEELGESQDNKGSKRQKIIKDEHDI